MNEANTGHGAVEQGRYYRKQPGSDSGVIAWSHRARFEVGLGLIGSSRRLMDYGCGDSDYRFDESYSFPNALRMIFAGRRPPVARPVYGEPGAPCHSHYGFNWKTLRAKAREHLIVESLHFSPLGFSRGLASSQAWFVCRPIPSSVPGR